MYLSIPSLAQSIHGFGHQHGWARRLTIKQHGAGALAISLRDY